MEASEGFSSRELIYARLLRASIAKDAAKARPIYSLMVSHGLHTLSSLADHVIRLFALSGHLQDAHDVFSRVSSPSVYTWNSIISAHIRSSRPDDAMSLFRSMIRSGVEPDQVSFLYALQACGGEEAPGLRHLGRAVHSLLLMACLDSDVLVGSTLIDMYAKCGCLLEAHRVLSNLRNRNSVSWGVLISGYARHGDICFSLHLIDAMYKEGLIPDRATFLSVLKACGGHKARANGMSVHLQMVCIAIESDHFLLNSLVGMYAKCGLMEEAFFVFENSVEKDVISWVALISGYIELGKDKYSIQLFWEMQRQGVLPDRVSCLCVLKACANLGAVVEAHSLHVDIVKHGFDINTDIQNALIFSYSKCGSGDEAYVVFRQCRNRDVVTWGTLIAGYVEEGLCSRALELFHASLKEAVDPNAFLFSSISLACGILRMAQEGRLIHIWVTSNGYESDAVVANSLVDMYAKCHCLNDSYSVFSNLVYPDELSYGALISGLVKNEHVDLALELFQTMQNQGINPNQALFASMFKACGMLESSEKGGIMFSQVIEHGLECDGVVVSSLMDMYIKCGSLEDAHAVFRSMEERDVVLWGIMITGHVESEHVSAAIQLYQEMKEEGTMPSGAIFISILKSCSIVRTLDQGRRIHQDIEKVGFKVDSRAGYVENALLDMYAKCGSLKDAHEMFEALENRDVVSWGSMIAAYADSGDWMMAWNCLENMNKSELKPDATIFASILVSCGHAGMLDAGLAFFRLITSCYGLEPALLHYSLLIDLMARSGHLALALDLTETMPCIPKSFLWTSILTECVLYGETKLAYECFDEAFRLEPSDASGYVLILNALTNGRLIMDDGTEDRGKTKNESVEREHHDVVEPPSLKHTDLSENVECNFER